MEGVQHKRQYKPPACKPFTSLYIHPPSMYALNTQLTNPACKVRPPAAAPGCPCFLGRLRSSWTRLVKSVCLTAGATVGFWSWLAKVARFLMCCCVHLWNSVSLPVRKPSCD